MNVGHVAELPEPAEPLQRGDLVVQQAFLGSSERELPGGGLDLGGEHLERRWRRAGSHDYMMDRAREPENLSARYTFRTFSAPNPAIRAGGGAGL